MKKSSLNDFKRRFDLSTRELAIGVAIITVICLLLMVLAGTLIGNMSERFADPTSTPGPVFIPPPSFTPPPEASPTQVGTWLLHEPIAGVSLSLPPEFSGDFTSEYQINFDEILVPKFDSPLHRAELFILVGDPNIPYLAFDQENRESMTLFWMELETFTGAGPDGLDVYLDSVVEASATAGPAMDSQEVLLLGENVLGRLVFLLDYEIADRRTTYRLVQYTLMREETLYHFYFRSEPDEIAIKIVLFDKIAESIKVHP